MFHPVAYAHMDRLDYRWYFGFKMHDDGTITVIIHDRILLTANGHPATTGECKAIEGPGRILQSLIIKDKEYKVNNPKNIFQYAAFDGKVPL